MAGIIKADRWTDTPASPTSVAFNFEDISTRAREQLDTARQQARQIVSEAEQQAEQVRLQAREQGRQQALQEAQQLVGETLDQQLTTLVPALQNAIEDLRHSKAEWLRHWERQTVELAASIAERVIRRELRESPDISSELMREALELSIGSGDVTIQLHPDDYAAMREQAQAITGQLASIGSVTMVAADDVTLGGCRVVTEFGEVDQTIEAQLKRIVEELC